MPQQAQLGSSLIQWIYSSHTWLWGGSFILSLLAVSLLGLHFFSRFVSVETRRNNTENLAIVLGIVGSMYALLLSFIAIAAWESFSNAEKTVVLETDVISVLYRNTPGLPNTDAEKVKLRESPLHSRGFRLTHGTSKDMP